MGVRIVKAYPGDSITDNLDTKELDRVAQLVSSGITTDHEIAEEMNWSAYRARRVLRSPSVQEAIRAQVKADALVLKVKALETAAKDLEDESARTRAEARKYIKSEADDIAPQMVNQNNNIYDPSQDEALFERAQELFRSTGRNLIQATVTETLDQIDAEEEREEG